MRTPPMCFSMLRVPRCLVNTWWEGFDSVSVKCEEGYNFKLLGFSVNGHGGNSGRWRRRPITTTGEGLSNKSLSSSTANIMHGLSDEIVETRITKLTVKRTDSSKLQQVEYADVRQLIADNKDLVSLVTFIVFDLETTGLSKNDRIIEIALQDLRGGESSTFHTLVNPERAVPNAHIHGITTNMVNRTDVPRMHDLIPILLKFIRSGQKAGGHVVLVAHNARRFDAPFLVNEFKRCSMEIPQNLLFLDSHPLAREAMKFGGTKVAAKTSLQALREHYGIELDGSAHRAMSDVHSLSLVLQKITHDLKLPIASLMEKTFTANELTISSTKTKKDSS